MISFKKANCLLLASLLYLGVCNPAFAQDQNNQNNVDKLRNWANNVAPQQFETAKAQMVKQLPDPGTIAQTLPSIQEAAAAQNAQVMRAWAVIGRAYAYQGQVDKGLRIFNDATMAYRPFMPPDDTYMAMIFSDFGVYYYSIGKLKEAEMCLKGAIAQLERFPNPKTASALKASYLCMAAIKDKNGQLQEAANYADKSYGGTTDISQVKPYVAVASDTTVSAPVVAAESKPKPKTKPNRPFKDKWALVIGISNFANPKYNLGYAAKDAKDFYDFLINEGNFKKDHVLMLLNEKATRANIMNAFGDNFLPAVSEEDDLVVIYISTHGTPARKDKGGRNYIVAYDSDAQSLYSTGVDMNELYRRIKEGVKTDRALIVMDTCYSGAGVPGAKALNSADNFDAQDIAQGSGHLVITSSSPNERSWESKVSANGVFTKYLLEAFRADKKGDVKQAFNSVKKNVGWEVKSAFGESQTPQLGGEWEGKELVLTVPAVEPRKMLNADLLKMMQASSSPVKSTVPVKK
ncbi:caspase family protein [bacterium]|nr:caspase family protein [bacterium]QQR58089.1 MAG: caspase family protein [Candidatus Melainabacteria bacterium]